MTATARKYDADAFDRLWKSIKPGKGISLGTLIHNARQQGWTDPPPTSSGTEHVTDEWPEPHAIKDALLSVPKFDLNLLPDVFRAFVADASELMQAPPEFIAVPLVVSAAATMGNRWAIAPKAKDLGWKVAPVLWGAIIGRPGTKKSPCMSKALSPLSGIEAKLAAEHNLRLQKYKADLLAYEIAVAKAKKAPTTGAMAPLPLKPEEPKPERLWCNDTTYQKLGDILSASPRGVLVEMDELVGLLEGLRAKGQEGSRAFFLTGWNGNQPYRIDRVGRGSTVIERLAISVLGGMQPSKLQNYVHPAMRGGNDDDGLMQRFQLLVWPDIDNEWKDVDRYHDQQAYDDVVATFGRIRDLDPVTIGAAPDIVGGPAYLKFAPDAQSLFNQARAGFERLSRSGNCAPALEAHFSKYPRMIAALALVIHVTDGGLGPVDLCATEKAIGWSKYLARHAQRAYGAAENRAAPSAKVLSEKIEQGKVKSGFTIRSIVRNGWHQLSSTEDVTAALEWLVDANWIMAEELKTAGRSTILYKINPKIGGK